MNEFQEQLCKHYFDGDYAYIIEPSNRENWAMLAESVGDALFLFLMRELADEVGVNLTRGAVQRLKDARAAIDSVLFEFG